MTKPTVTKITVDYARTPIQSTETGRYFLVAQMSKGREAYSKAVIVKLNGESPESMRNTIEAAIGNCSDGKEAEKILQKFAS